MRTLLVGPGAIGGTLAVFAAKAGFVFDVLGRPDEAAYLRDNDFWVTGKAGDHLARLRVYGSIDELEGHYDCVMIATKAQAMPRVCSSLIPKMRGDTLVLGLQNGITSQLMSEVVGAERTVSCMIGIGATMSKMGQSEMTSKGHFLIGGLCPQDSPAYRQKLEYLRSFVDACQPCEITGNIIGELYSKLVFNACVNSLCALAGMPMGKLMNHKKAREAFLSIGREGMAVAKAIGLDVPPFMGFLDYKLIANHTGKIADTVFERLFQVIGKVRLGKLRPSTLQSLDRGELTEIDYLNGYFVMRGDEAGVDCPVNKQIIAMIHEIEEGVRRTGVENINALALKRFAPTAEDGDKAKQSAA
ncbi:MAG: ketopantoate reductase family protein [Oscillospiraceae bacterium]|nr:ketopantoate reductase family protein [Oscillospiraceae bacterium]